MVYEILLVFFGLIGLASCVRLAARRLLFPVREALILIPARGSGRELEQQLRGVHALSSEGLLEGATVLLSDQGLDAEGVAVAAQLCAKYPDLRLCPSEAEQSIGRRVSNRRTF